MNEWFQLRADFQGKRAAFTLNDQPPLIVNRVSRSVRRAHRLWTTCPPIFDPSVSETPELPKVEGANPVRPPGVVDEWFIRIRRGRMWTKGRYKPEPPSAYGARRSDLIRQFAMPASGGGDQIRVQR
jgi:hypothetical protein